MLDRRNRFSRGPQTLGAEGDKRQFATKLEACDSLNEREARMCTGKGTEKGTGKGEALRS